MSKTRAIVNLATGSWYPLGQRRLNASLDNVGFTGLREFYVSERDAIAPPHSRIPYAFKAHALARSDGNLVLWCDSSMWAVKPLDPIFEAIEQDGYAFCHHLNFIGQWTNDAALKAFQISRDAAMGEIMLSAGFFGLDLTRTIGTTILDELLRKASLFPGERDNANFTESTDSRCRGHRHDQSVLSLLAREFNCRIRFGQETITLLQEGQPPPETAIFLARGMRGDETEQDWMKV